MLMSFCGSFYYNIEDHLNLVERIRKKATFYYAKTRVIHTLYYRIYIGQIKELHHCKFKFRMNVISKEHQFYCYHYNFKQFMYFLHFIIHFLCLTWYVFLQLHLLFAHYLGTKHTFKKKTNEKDKGQLSKQSLETKKWPLYIFFCNLLHFITFLVNLPCTDSAILRK